MTDSARRGGSLRTITYAIVVPIVCAAMVAASIWLSASTRDQLGELNPDAVPVTGPVIDGTVDFATAATATITAGAVPALLSTGLAGTITSLAITAGATFEPGDELFRVNGVAVTAYGGDVVLYRPLTSGDRGEDVRALQALLSTLLPDIAIEADGIYGASTAAAVRRFESSIGIARPTGAFSPAWVVRLPQVPYSVASTDLNLGASAPALDAELATASAGVAQVTFSSPGFAGPAGDYEFISAGQTAPVSFDGETWTLAAADVGALVTAPLSLDAPSQLEGRVRLADGAPAQLIPGGALITDPGGATCVALVGSDGTPTTAAVTVLGTDAAGPLQIAPDLPEGSQVLINPLDVLGESAACPSN